MCRIENVHLIHGDRPKIEWKIFNERWKGSKRKIYRQLNGKYYVVILKFKFLEIRSHIIFFYEILLDLLGCFTLKTIILENENGPLFFFKSKARSLPIFYGDEKWNRRWGERQGPGRSLLPNWSFLGFPFFGTTLQYSIRQFFITLNASFTFDIPSSIKKNSKFILFQFIAQIYNLLT